MPTIDEVSGAIVPATVKPTLALVNANIDFSLIKYESPEEYRGLGAALSFNRRTVAEDGPIHSVARKLGALFEGVLPEAPNLITAYGIRVARIAEER